MEICWQGGKIWCVGMRQSDTVRDPVVRLLLGGPGQGFC